MAQARSDPAVPSRLLAEGVLGDAADKAIEDEVGEEIAAAVDVRPSPARSRRRRRRSTHLFTNPIPIRR